MAKIKLNFGNLSIPEKIARARQIVTALTGNADYASPQPALADVTSAIDKLETAYSETLAARQAAKEKTSAQNQKEDEFDRIISRLASYVESASGGDETKIKSVGMDVRALASATERLDLPAALAATAGDREGAIDLQWDKVARAKSYVIESSLDPPTNDSWQHKAVSTKSRITIEGLTSGTKYWFRVAAVGANGQSGWSDPATKIAP